jgi:hypothetical protein
VTLVRRASALHVQAWLREAEIKHCRVSMLAFVGFIFTDFYTLPGFEYTTLEAHDACVASGAMSQLLLWIGLLEVVSFVAIDQTLRGSGREPGDFVRATPCRTALGVTLLLSRVSVLRC